METFSGMGTELQISLHKLFYNRLLGLLTSVKREKSSRYIVYTNLLKVFKSTYHQVWIRLIFVSATKYIVS